MNILIADDEKDLLSQYEMFLSEKGHSITTCADGEECVKTYKSQNEKIQKSNGSGEQVYDAVILDYMMPKKNGIDVAKEILAVNPHQRIIFASGHIQNTFFESIQHLKQMTEIMQKPFALQALADTIEDTEIYSELEKLNVDIAAMKELNPSHAQIKAYFDVLCRLQKGRTF